VARKEPTFTEDGRVLVECWWFAGHTPTVNATLLGDTIHTMPPLRSAGAYTALRDAELLRRKLMDVAEDNGVPSDQRVRSGDAALRV
jgi:2-polyprenyl-6-methoxyphenol hydroxylase-like FAD-dependent oxidoreductase